MLTSFLITVAVVLALVILRAYSFAEDAARHLARAERERLQSEHPDHVIAALDEEAFIACFEWLRRRRFWIYMAGFMAVAATVTLVVMAILSFVHEVINPGPWMWGFIAVFSLTAAWAASAWATLYLHRVRRDASLLKNAKRWPGLQTRDKQLDHVLKSGGSS